MISDPNCLFCRLIAREGDVSVVHEEARTTTIMDTQPVRSGLRRGWPSSPHAGEPG
jgi:hypothetical protein